METKANVNEQPLVMPPLKGPSKVIDIINPQAPEGQDVKETVVEHGTGGEKIDAKEKFAKVFEAYPEFRKYGSLREAATTGAFPALLRDGLKAILFDSYNTEPTTYDQLVFVEPSNKPAEDWVEANMLGVLPLVDEGQSYPELDATLDRAVRIANYKRGAIFGITEEMTRFDRLNMIKQYPRDLGVTAKVTAEQAVYSVLNTAGNYVRNSTTNDNDIGANTAATTFSASGLITAYATLRTMKDRKSGRYLNIVPNVLIVTPQLEFAAKQLLLAPELRRASANNAAEVYGTGGVNPFRGLINQIVVSPYLGTSYQWVLGVAGKGLVYQEVDPLQMLTLAADGGQLSEGYFLYDKLRYRVRIWFGTGFMNDRYWYYSSSSSAPAAA